MELTQKIIDDLNKADKNVLYRFLQELARGVCAANAKADLLSHKIGTDMNFSANVKTRQESDFNHMMEEISRPYRKD